MVYHNQPWSTVVNHGPISHYDKNCLHIKIIDNHGQSRSTMVSHGCWWSTMFYGIKHGQTCLNVVLWQKLSQYENQPWSTMVQRRIVTKIVSIWKLTMVQHGIVIRIFSIWKSTMVNHVCFSVYNIYLGVYIRWVYNINPFGLILFPWGFSINPLGL